MEAAKLGPDSQVKTVKRFAAFVHVILILKTINAVYGDKGLIIYISF